MADTVVGSVTYEVKLDWSKALQGAPGMGANLQAALNRQTGSGVVGGSPGVASSGVIFSPMAGSAGSANMPRGGTAWGGGGFVGGPTQVYGGGGGGGGGSGGGPGFPGGGGGDDDRIGRSFFNRFVFVAGLREAGRIAQASRQYSIDSGMAGNDQRASLKATMDYRRSLTEGAFGIGQLAGFAQDPTGSGELGVNRALQSADSTDAATKAIVSYGQYRSAVNKDAAASSLTGSERKKVDAMNDFEDAKKEAAEKNRAATEAQRKSIMDTERSASQDRYNKKLEGMNFFERMSNKAREKYDKEGFNKMLEDDAQQHAAPSITEMSRRAKKDQDDTEAKLGVIRDNKLRDIATGETLALGKIAGASDDRESAETTDAIGMRRLLVGDKRGAAKVAASAPYADAVRRFMRNPGSPTNLADLSRTYDQSSLENQVIDRDYNVREGIALNSSKGLGKQLDAVIANRLVKSDAIGIETAGINRLIADKAANQGKLFEQDEANTVKQFEALKVNFLRSLRGGEVSSSQLGGGTAEIGKTLQEIQDQMNQFKADVIAALNAIFN